jgi:hypothetical protein
MARELPSALLLLLGIVRLRDGRALPAVERRGLYAATPALLRTDGGNLRMRLRGGAVEGRHEDTHDSAMTPPRRSVRPADQATSNSGAAKATGCAGPVGLPAHDSEAKPRAMNCSKPGQAHLERSAAPTPPASGDGLCSYRGCGQLLVEGAEGHHTAKSSSSHTTRSPAGIATILENLVAACSDEHGCRHGARSIVSDEAQMPELMTGAEDLQTVGRPSTAAAAPVNATVDHCKQGRVESTGAEAPPRDSQPGGKAGAARVLGAAGVEALEVRDVLASLGPAAFPVLMFFLAVPCALGIPGFSIVLGSVEAFLALQLLAGIHVWCVCVGAVCMGTGVVSALLGV